MARPAAAKIPRLVIVATIFVVVAALYFAQPVLMPLALAVLLSFLLAPLCNRLERAGLHRIPSVLVVFTIMLLLVAVVGWVVYVQMLELANRLPQYQDDIAMKIRSLVGTEPGALGKAAATLEEVGRRVAEPDGAATQPATAPATQGAGDAGASPAAPPYAPTDAGTRVDPPNILPINPDPPTLVPQGAPLTGPPPPKSPAWSSSPPSLSWSRLSISRSRC
jgi:hypothetical protein